MSDLASWRREFPILDTCTYLVSHSLGAMPQSTAENLQAYAAEWSTRGVRAWAECWWELGIEVGNLLAPILGAPADSISMHQNVTVAQGIVASCHRFEGTRRTVVLTDLEFPSNIYLYEAFRKYGAEIRMVACGNQVEIPTERLLDAIDDRTLLVPISYALFRSAALVDIEAVVAKAHRVGARVVLDAYQAAGAVPLELERWGVDFAVGGSVKWLCGGPGAGYLYVRPDLAPSLEPAVTGWAAHANPFAFEVGPSRLAGAPRRFQTGTPNIPGLYAARAGYEIIAQVGVPAIRARSLELTRRLIEGVERRGLRLRTPTDDARRGGTVTIDVPNGAAAADELLRRQVIVDYRPGAGIRVAPHFYNTPDEIDRALLVLDEIVAGAPVN